MSISVREGLPRTTARLAKRVAAGEPALGRARRVGRMLRTLAATHPDAHCELDFTTPLELAVATILSAQSTDKLVNQVPPALFAHYRTAPRSAGRGSAGREPDTDP